MWFNLPVSWRSSCFVFVSYGILVNIIMSFKLAVWLKGLGIMAFQFVSVKPWVPPCCRVPALQSPVGSQTICLEIWFLIYKTIHMLQCTLWHVFVIRQCHSSPGNSGFPPASENMILTCIYWIQKSRKDYRISFRGNRVCIALWILEAKLEA